RRRCPPRPAGRIRFRLSGRLWACRSDPRQGRVTPVPTTRPLDEVTIRTSFARFRIASIVEAIALLVLVGVMRTTYVVYALDGWFASVPPAQDQISSVLSPIHGLIYMIYVVLASDLW